jgi:hypothetical protein
MIDRELLELAASSVRYDEVAGKLFWLPKELERKDAGRWNARYAHKECGTLDDKGYRRILMRANGKVLRIRVHQLIWFIANGDMANGEIDHINQDKLDNRISNLRDVSGSENLRNSPKKRNNTSGVNGVCWHKVAKKWYATARVSGVVHYLGVFDDLSEAEKIVVKFRSENGFTENHGKRLSNHPATGSRSKA